MNADQARTIAQLRRKRERLARELDLIDRVLDLLDTVPGKAQSRRIGAFRLRPGKTGDLQQKILNRR